MVNRMNPYFDDELGQPVELPVEIEPICKCKGCLAQVLESLFDPRIEKGATGVLYSLGMHLACTDKKSVQDITDSQVDLLSRTNDYAFDDRLRMGVEDELLMAVNLLKNMSLITIETRSKNVAVTEKGLFYIRETRPGYLWSRYPEEMNITSKVIRLKRLQPRG